jgi:flagellar motor switch protein FliN/FliY
VANNDELLTPEEIEALMQAARSGPPPGTTPIVPPAPAIPGASENMPFPAGGGGAAAQPITEGQQTAWSLPNPESLLQEAESQLSAALANDYGRPKGPPPELGPPQGFSFPDFSPAPAESQTAQLPISTLQDVELDLRVELGRTELLIEEVLQLREGTVVPLDKLAGDPVDILVNGRLVARGEVLVLNDNFCVRVAEIVTPEM